MVTLNLTLFVPFSRLFVKLMSFPLNSLSLPHFSICTATMYHKRERKKAREREKDKERKREIKRKREKERERERERDKE